MVDKIVDDFVEVDNVFLVLVDLGFKFFSLLVT
jgi:hypothetical protein